MRLTVLAGAFSFVLWSGMPASADKASADAIIGKTWNFKQGKASGKITYRANSVSATINGKTFRGKLRRNGDMLCTSYEQLRGGKEECFGVSRSGKGYKTTTGGILTP